jgi:heme/copper-type cytochrome/quinol oxidase subunit 2
VIEVRIADGAVQTDADRVEVAAGQSVRVVVTSDVDDELHVHGVDETVDLVAGETTTLDVTVDEPGVFDVETHEGGLLLFQLVVR